MAEAWLEVRSCDGEAARELDHDTVLRLPLLAEAMKVAEGAAGDAQRKGSKHWEYSVRLAGRDLDDLTPVFAGTAAIEDERSARQTVDVKYNGRCYALALFTFKE